VNVVRIGKCVVRCKEELFGAIYIVDAGQVSETF
jgi:hypothetical protein